MKLLILALIVAAVWLALRGRKSIRARDGVKSVEAEDLTKCPICGTYVSIRSGKPCGRDNCPAGPLK